jgi:hypothetical protein
VKTQQVLEAVSPSSSERFFFLPKLFRFLWPSILSAPPPHKAGQGCTMLAAAAAAAVLLISSLPSDAIEF